MLVKDKLNNVSLYDNLDVIRRFVNTNKDVEETINGITYKKFVSDIHSDNNLKIHYLLKSLKYYKHYEFETFVMMFGGIFSDIEKQITLDVNLDDLYVEIQYDKPMFKLNPSDNITSSDYFKHLGMFKIPLNNLTIEDRGIVQDVRLINKLNIKEK